MHAFTRTQRWTGLIFVVATAALFLAFVIRPLASPLVLALLIMILFNPLHRRVERLLGAETIGAAVASTLLLGLLVLLPALGVALVLFRQGQTIVEQLAGEESVEGRMVQLFHQYLDWLADFGKRFGYELEVDALANQVTERATTLLYDGVPTLVSHLGALALAFSVAAVAVISLLYRGRTLKNLLVELSPLDPGHTHQIFERIEHTVQALFIGAFLTALSQGALGSFGFWLAGFDNFLVMGALVLMASFVPIFGTALVWFPATLFLFSAGKIQDGLILLVVGVVISTADNALRAFLIQGRAEVNVVLIFISLLGGLITIGPMGLIYGPLLAGLLVEAIQIYRSDLLKKPKIEAP
jgi:predicted PurR-regulated permease PerM